MNYDDFRSGTAPTAPSRTAKPPPGSRTRPKTRNVTERGSSDLSDLNMSIKMEKNNVANTDAFVEAVEDFQSALEKWESTPRSRPVDDNLKNTSSSPYTNADHVTAAYTSQFKPIRADSAKMSSKSTASKSKAAEIRAVYGMFGKTSSTSSSNSTKRENTRKYSDSSEPNDISRGGKSNNNSNTDSTKINRKPVTVTTAPPSAKHQVNEVQEVVDNLYCDDKDFEYESHESDQDRSGCQGGSYGSGSAATSGGDMYLNSKVSSDRSDRYHSAQHAHAHPSLLQDTTSAKARAHSAHLIICDADAGTIPMLTIDDSIDASYANSATMTPQSDQRPQSRKLYLGSSPSSTSVGRLSVSSNQGQRSHGNGGSTSGLRPHQSNTNTPSHVNVNPNTLFINQQSQSITYNYSSSSLQSSHTIASGRNNNTTYSSPMNRPNNMLWDDNLDVVQRPPSRQRTAFPVHLADNISSDNTVVGSIKNKKKNMYVNDTDMSCDAPSSCRKGSEGSVNPTLTRPPSRQRIWAPQNLWEEGLDDHNRFSESHRGRDSAGSNGDYYGMTKDGSPSLTPYGSSVSIGFHNDFVSNDDSYSHEPKLVPEFIPANYKGREVRAGTTGMRNRAEGETDDTRYSHTAQSFLLGPMYDPVSDGFTQLDTKPNNLSFKIQVCTVEFGGFTPFCMGRAGS